MKKKLMILWILPLVLFFVSNNFLFAEEKDIVELEPIVITPWRAEEISANISKNVAIITEEDIARSTAKYVYELIKEEAGVVVTNLIGNPKGQLIDIRGFGQASKSNILVLVDGRRTNQVDLSGVDWGQIDLHSVKQIEIIRGSGTVLYGDNATAGVINIITKKGTTKKPAITMSSEIGSHQYHRVSGDVSGATKSTDYFFGYSHSQNSGYRANSHYWSSDYSGRGSVSLTDQFNVGVSCGYHRDHYGLPGALYIDGNPSAIIPVGINDIGRRGTVFPDDGGRTEDYYINGEPTFSLKLGRHDIIATVFGSFRSRRNKGLGVPELTTTFPARGEYETVHHIKSYELRPKLEFDLDFFDSKIINRLTLGSDYFHATDQVLSGNRLVAQDELVIKKQTFALYLHDNIRVWDKMLLNAGARGEWADYTFDQYGVIPNRDEKDLKEAAYEIGAGYKYNDVSQIYTNFSRSYRNPNTEEYYMNKWIYGTFEGGGLSTDIKEQIAHTFEIGIKDATFKWLRLNADYYWMGVKNEIYLNPTNGVNSNYKPKTIHQGFEIESFIHLFDDMLKPYATCTLQEAYFKGGTYANECIPMVPKTKFSTGIFFAPLEGLEWSAVLNYVGSRFVVNDQRNVVPKLKPYSTVDTKLSYAWKNLKTYFAINNLFNKKYHAYGVTNSTQTVETFYPAPERTFETGVTFTF